VFVLILQTRRFLVNRVKCAQWERRSHFHLTAIDHMLGNVQPALFDVATMLRGHLRICAVARASMVAHQKTQSVIQGHQQTKEHAFETMKQLLIFLEHAQARSLELRHLAAEVLKKLGPDLERFLERKRRARKTAAGTSLSPTTQNPFAAALLSRHHPSNSTQAVSAALTAAAPPAPASWSDPEVLDAELSHQGMGHGEFNVLGLGQEDEGSLGLGEGLAAVPHAAQMMSPSSAGNQGGLLAVAMSLAQQTSQTATPSRFQLSVAPPSGNSPSPDSSPLESPDVESALELGGEQERGPLASPIELQLPTPSQSRGNSTSPQSSPTMQFLRPSPNTASSESSQSRSQPSSPPSPMAWPALGSAPPTAPSLLFVAAASEDVWPEEGFAAEHVDHVNHPVHHGHSSLAIAEEHAPGSSSSSPGSVPVGGASQRRRKSSAGSPGSSPRSPSSMPGSPPRTPPSLMPVGSSSGNVVSAVSSSGTSAGPHASILTSPPRNQVAMLRAGTEAGFAATRHAYSGLTGENSASMPAASSAPVAPSGLAMSLAAAAAAAATAASSSAVAPASASPSHSSSAAATAASASARQGYINIKMRYYAQLGQTQKSPIMPHAPPQTTSPRNAVALALAMPIGGMGRRGKTSELLPLSPPGLLSASAPASPAPAASLSTSAPTSPSSVLTAESLSSPPSSPSSPSTLRSRAVLARTEDDGAASPNKRWMLRPLPANVGPGTPPSSPLQPESPSPRPSPSSPAAVAAKPANATSSTSPLPMPVAKKSWWRGLFSSSKEKSEPAKSSSTKSNVDVSRKGSVAAVPHTRKTSMALPVSPSAMSGSAGASPVVEESLPPLPDEPRILASDWAALSNLLEAIEATNEKQQRAWEVLESVLDKRERVQAEERAAARVTAQREAEEAARRAAEEEGKRLAREAEAEAALPRTYLPAFTPSLLVSAAAAPVDVLGSSSPKHGHSSHSSVTSSSALLLSSASSAFAPTPSDTGAESSSAPSVAARSQRKSVLSVLQGVPAPMLMPAQLGDVRLSVGDEVVGAASTNHATGTSSLLQSLPPLAVNPRAASIPGSSRSQPTTPPSPSSSPKVSDGRSTGAVTSASHAPVRRASDSAAVGASSVTRAQSSPASSMVRSSSYSMNMAQHMALVQQAASHIRSHSFSEDATLDVDLLALVETRRAQQMRHDSPPSPSSMVC
jgi:hypothetical protein